MDFRRLEVFCKVVELKSFTRAAEALRLSQPTVSEHIRQLEESVGEKLLDRLGREVLPTPAGRLLGGYAVRILRLCAEARQALTHFGGTLSGPLPLGASTIPGAYLLPSCIETFTARHPSIQVTLKIADTARISREVLEGSLELALVGARSREAGLECVELFGDELLLCVPPDHPWARRRSLPLAELAGEPFILREEGSGTRQYMNQRLKEQGFDPGRLQVVAEMGSNEAVRQGIRARLGVSILSSLAVAEDVERAALAIVPLEGVRFPRPFYLTRRHGRQLSPAALTFLELLQERSGA